MRNTECGIQNMPKGPRGERRPSSPISSMVRAMEVATGIREEEYGDSEPRAQEGEANTASDSSSDSDGEDYEPEYEEAALEMPDPPPKKNKRREKKRKRKIKRD